MTPVELGHELAAMKGQFPVDLPVRLSKKGREALLLTEQDPKAWRVGKVVGYGRPEKGEDPLTVRLVWNGESPRSSRRYGPAFITVAELR